MFILLLSGCTTNANPDQVVSFTEATMHPTTTVTDTLVRTPTHKTTLLQAPEPQTGTMSGIASSLPHLWREIDPEKISIYYDNWIFDYAYAEDGSLWIVGTFGVMHVHNSGTRDWYNINTGMPVNTFRSVAISPSGEVWVGGTGNSLLHFNGEQWIDESLQLPPPFDPREDRDRNAKDIIAIDFDQNGNAWVINCETDIYTQVYNQWMNFQFPREIHWLTYNCPNGLRVVSENDITIKIPGCCESGPRGMHFDGTKWTSSSYTVVDELLDNRKTPAIYEIEIGEIHPSYTTNWMFSQVQFLPAPIFGYHPNINLMADDEVDIWIAENGQLFNNKSGEFLLIADNRLEDSDVAKSDVMNFTDQILFYQEGKSALSLYWYTSETFLGSYNGAYPTGTYPTVDHKDRIWLYSPEHGLVMIDHGEIHIIDQLNELNTSNRGGILPLDNGSVLIGSTGRIWMLVHDQWKNYVIPNCDELLIFLKKDKNGNIYAATDTGVYQFQIDNNGEILLIDDFPSLMQDEKPWIVTEDSTMTIGSCIYTEYYAVFSNCYNYKFDTTPTVHYDVKLMHIQEDGAVIFITNHTIGQLKDEKWKTYLFDTIDIQSAAVDQEGAIWIYTGVNGLLRLAPDVFDSFQDFALE